MMPARTLPGPQPGRPRVIVFGNEKGGTGKSTLAMHLAAGLMHRGLRVATIDLDARQGTLTRYVTNRRRYAERTHAALPQPTHRAIEPNPFQNVDEAELTKALDHLSDHDAIIIDTPGSETSLSQAGHTWADVLVTPLNDSLIDLDVLADVDPVKRAVANPSRYAERVWKAKQLRARRDGGSIDWVVVRNRLDQLDARNKRLVGKLMTELAKRIGFRVLDGISERVIYREMFLDGLTVEDLAALEKGGGLAMSHVAARQEMRALVNALHVLDRLETWNASSA